MRDTFAELYYHFVWATKLREPYLTDAVEAMVYKFVTRACEDRSVKILGLNGMPDHVHLACSCPTTIRPSDFIHDIKGGSSHFIKHETGSDLILGWQEGYGVLTFARRDIRLVVNYIANQKQHHAQNTINARMEQTNVP